MKRGDLVKISWVNQPDDDLLYKIPDKLCVCVEPQIIACHNHYGSYRGIKLLNSDGTTTVYPVDRWTFQVLE